MASKKESPAECIRVVRLGEILTSSCCYYPIFESLSQLYGRTVMLHILSWLAKESLLDTWSWLVCWPPRRVYGVLPSADTTSQVFDKVWTSSKFNSASKSMCMSMSMLNSNSNANAAATNATTELHFSISTNDMDSAYFFLASIMCAIESTLNQVTPDVNERRHIGCVTILTMYTWYTLV